MTYTFVTLFPKLISFYFEDSILSRAVKAGHITCKYINPREYSTNKHAKVDKQMVGGGAGLLMTAQPLWDTLNKIKEDNPDAYIVFPVPAGKPFIQNDAKRLSKKEHIVFVSGRYEGIDERIIETFADEVFSVGDFILTGGELPSLTMADAISRNIPDVLGNSASLEIESYENALLEAPSFTKPLEFEKKYVTSEYLKGNHSKIHDLKKQLSIAKTKFFRPRLLKNYRVLKDKT